MMHGPDLKKARRAYREFLHDGIDQELTSPLKESVAGTLLGSKEYVDKVTQLLRRKRPDREVPVSRLLGAVSLEEVEGAVCKAFGVRPESLRVRGKHGNEPRKVAMYVARRMTGSPVGTIGEHFGGVGAAAVCIAVKEVEKRRQEDKTLDQRIRRVEQEAKEYGHDPRSR